MLGLHIEKIVDLAVVECEGRIARSEAAFKLREASHIPTKRANHCA
jgi:hypothetical protein